MIAEYLKKYSTACTTIAYGAEVVEHADVSALKEMQLPLTDYVLHMGRIQPDNHIKEILEAAKASGKMLITIGDYTNRYGRQLKKRFKDCSSIYFTGSLYDKNILNELRLNCDAYLHGHSAGGTNPALLEAMGCGAFILAHNNPFNASTLGGLGALWSDPNELSDLLRNLPNQEIKLKQRELSRNRIRESFNWETVASQYLDAFKTIN
jgi:glycosyltransferase involved in cell wall biosynthesis